MKVRTDEEIEKVFREIGLTEKTWGQLQVPPTDDEKCESHSQVFIRIESTTKPLQDKTDADLA